MHRVYENIWMIRDIRTDGRRAAMAFLLSFLLAFSEFLGQMLLGGAMAGEAIHPGIRRILMMVAGAFLCALIAEPILFRLMGAAWHACAKKTAVSLNDVFAAVWGLTFLAYIPCFLAFYPGLYTYDIGWQWSMYAGEGYSTHHSLLHTWLSGTFFECGRQLFGSYNAGMALYALFQLIVLSGSMAFAVRYLVKIGAPKKIWVSAALFYMVFPFFPLMGISTTKDVIYGALCLIVIVCLAEMASVRAVYRGWRLILFAAVIILMGQFRNNAIYSVLFVLVCLILSCLRQLIRREKNRIIPELTALFFICAAGIAGVNQLLVRSFDAYAGSVAEMLSVPCQQLARVYAYHGDELTAEERERLFSFIPEDFLARYTYYLSDPVKSGLDVPALRDDPEGFLELWIRLGREYPEEYILSPLYNTMGIWYLTGDSSCYVDFGLAWIFDEEHVIEPDSRLPALREVYQWFQNENIRRTLPFVGMIFYTSFYAWLLYLCLAVLFAKRRDPEMVGGLYLFAYVLTLALGPCIQIRYMFGTLLCTPILLAAAFRERDGEEASRPIRRRPLEETIPD